MKRLELPVDRIGDLYAIGVPMVRIALDIGTVRGRVKRIVRRECLARDPTRYGEGVCYLAAPGETFAETSVAGYWVSDAGRVVSMLGNPGIELKPEVDKDGYHRVKLYSEGYATHWHVHRLVLTTFRGPAGQGQLSAHNNGVRADNRLGNLRWATQAQNVADKMLHGTHQAGSKHGRAKADELSIARVKKLLRSGKTLADTAAETAVSFNTVADVSRGRTWRHVA